MNRAARMCRYRPTWLRSRRETQGRCRLSGSNVSAMGEVEERTQLALDHLADVIEHLQLLAADSETQNAWLQPCGWTRQEPCVHFADRKGCVPVDELYLPLDDMWPMWRAPWDRC